MGLNAKQKKFSEQIIENCVLFFKNIDLIDDCSFAKGWISARLAKPYGINRIRYELKQKGVKQEIINQQIEILTPEIDEEHAAQTLAQKQVQKYKNITHIKKRQRLYAYLSRRGFSSYAIHKALNEI